MASVLDTAAAATSTAGVSAGAHQLDEQRLLAYLRATLPGLLGDTPGPLRAVQFQHGQSNPTFLLELPAGGGGSSTQQQPHQHRMVLRKQPPGRLLASAHAVDREYRVLAALARSGRVPVPRPLALCQDTSLLGTQFYVMEFAAGCIFLDPNLPDLAAQQRSDVYTRAASTLASLHSVDPQAVGLEGFGNPTHYCRRQVDRWAKQYLASVDAAQQAAPLHARVLALIGWLRGAVPPEDASLSVAAVVHGDYRLDNLVFDGRLHVKAVLDWELATLGNAWADVAYLCLPHHLPPALASLSLRHPLSPGIPSEQQLLQAYCSATGRDPPPPAAWVFYLALSLFRLLAILAGVQARAKKGNASSAKAAIISSDEVLSALVDAALRITAAAQQQAGSVASGSSSSSSSIVLSVSSNLGSTAGGSSGSGGGGGAPPATSITAPLRAAGLGEPSAAARALLARLQAFMAAQVYPAEQALEEHAAGLQRWSIHPLVEQLKQQARAQGLWNLWMPADMASQLQHLLPLVPEAERGTLLGCGLTHLDYAHLCMLLGTSLWAPELCNCSAPDTGNMEVLAKYGSREQQVDWLLPLLRGHIRSCFAMTEKLVASSDATNITAAITRVPAGSSSSSSGGSYRVSGLKWWTSGAMDPRCKVAIFMGKTDPSAAPHAQQSMVIVPMDAPGVTVVRPMAVFGYDDAPHGHAEVCFADVVVPASNLLLGEGRGFEIAQGRLGPGRLHHCMRLVGAAERALSLAAHRALDRVAFGRPLAAQGGLREVLARQRVALEGVRLLVLNASHALDRVGHKAARGEIAAAKVAAPQVALQIIDAAIQIHGGAGVSQDTVLAHLWAAARTLRIADGPDEVHLGTLAKLELEAAAGGSAALKQRMQAGAQRRQPKL